MRFPLMRNNILREDLDSVIKHLRQDDPKLTQGEKVREFERQWSNWLGTKYSVFVNSGASSNLVTMAILKQRFPTGGEIIVPPLTWSSDIYSVVQNGFKPVFVDINPLTLGMNNDLIKLKVTEQTRAVFLSHIQGFNALTQELLDFLRQQDIILVEDVCESHGASFNGIKLGNFGLISNFSFYYAHHMSTIEGGMICTNDQEVYEAARMLRGHGLVREASSAELKDRYKKEHADLNPEFIFASEGYNVRNTEIGGILGISQLRRLDNNIKLRNRNHFHFLERLDSAKFKTDFFLEGSSNYAFNLVLRDKNDDLVARLMSAMRESGIEFRRGSAGGGNQLRQPYVQRHVKPGHYSEFPETEHIHFYGFYIGNFPDLSLQEIDDLVSVLNGC